jgi:hypothetical protein
LADRTATASQSTEWSRVAGERRGLLVSRVWVQATLLVVLCGFFMLGLLAYRTYMAQPQRVVDSQDRLLYSGRDIQKGQQVFLHNGLMEYGSAFGHGAYLGPDSPRTTCAAPPISSSASTGCGI